MEIIKKFKLNYLPPLMIFFAAGIAGFTDIVESFFVKNQLNLSVAFLANLAFWASVPWTFKMPVGHLVDIFWHKKAWFVYFGALLMTAGILIMIGLTGNIEFMNHFAPREKWYVTAVILSSVGFVFQNVVAEAMTVEAVPNFTPDGRLIPEKELQDKHVTMQTLGRIAIVGGATLVAGAGGWLAGTLSYKTMYEIALFFPILSISGVALASFLNKKQHESLKKKGFSENEIARMLREKIKKIQPNWSILILSALFILLISAFGVSHVPHKEEIIFVLSLLVIIYILKDILKDTDKKRRNQILAIAAIIFIYRVTPTFGAGASWWQIDVLGFNEKFFGTLRQISAIMAIFGMLIFRNWIARHSVAYFVVVLSIISTFFILPYIGIYYGIHQWTLAHWGFGARFIALVDTAAESPLDQVAMVPMLAWIAKEAPKNEKATYFAVFTAFTNMALSGSDLFTKYVNNFFHIERGNYVHLGNLMITVAVINLLLPILAVAIIYPKKLKSHF